MPLEHRQDLSASASSGSSMVGDADGLGGVASAPYGDARSNLTITAVILSRPPASFACATSVLQAAAGSDSARRTLAIASLVTISVNPSEHSSRRSPACTSSACAST